MNDLGYKMPPENTRRCQNRNDVHGIATHQCDKNVEYGDAIKYEKIMFFFVPTLNIEMV